MVIFFGAAFRGTYELLLSGILEKSIYDALRDSVPFVQCKKREKHS